MHGAVNVETERWSCMSHSQAVPQYGFVSGVWFTSRHMYIMHGRCQQYYNCLLSFVSSSTYTVLLLRCFLPYTTA